MEKVFIDIWPFLMTALIAAIGWQWRESYTLKTKVAVMEKTIEDVQKNIESMQKRQDSHSKKQDEIVSLITELKVEVVKQIGNMTTELGVLSVNVQNINSTLKVNDDGVVLKKRKNK